MGKKKEEKKAVSREGKICLDSSRKSVKWERERVRERMCSINKYISLVQSFRLCSYRLCTAIKDECLMCYFRMLCCLCWHHLHCTQSAYPAGWWVTGLTACLNVHSYNMCASSFNNLMFLFVCFFFVLFVLLFYVIQLVLLFMLCSFMIFACCCLLIIENNKIIK